MAGYIVYNGFWNQTPSDPVSRLHQAFARRGIALTPVPNTAFCVCVAPSVTVSVNGAALSSRDFVLFWDKDTRLALALEQSGVRLYNRAAAIMACDDKSETHRLLSAAGVPMPKTWLAPMTYVDVTAAVEPFLMAAERDLGFPMVLKECYGSFGNQVFLVNNGDELRTLSYSRGARPFLLQEYIAASFGEDTRLYCVGGRVAAAIRRRSDGDFRANVELGGRAEAYTPTERERELALQCCETLGLHFGAIDFLHDHQGNPLVCEVNSNAYMAGLIAGTGINIADVIADYVIEQEKPYGRLEGHFCQ